ncbi:MAG: acetyl-CoA hydrolase/transferase C-terminal domain-containing protein [Oceanococcus sp.]
MQGLITAGANMPTVHKNLDACVGDIIARVGKDISIGMPLGLGKPTALINALYARAREDETIKLRILTALSLQKPRGSSAVEKAFLEPFVKRVYADCPDLDYVEDLAANRLPANVEVFEFFFKPGSRLNNQHAQQHYISSNYTHAARDVFEQGCNVAAQLICKREEQGETRYSLSANPDTSPELIALLRASGRKHVVVGEVNQNLPYMYQDAEVTADTFDVVLDNPAHSTALFSTPKLPVATADYAIGLHASSLIKDGGTLQIGIGALGDAVVYATELRHQDNDLYRQLLQQMGCEAMAADLIDRVGGREPFIKGLYGATEMFVDGFMHLYQCGILKRRVYDDEHLQRLLNQGVISEEFGPEVLDLMEAEGERVIRTHEFDILQYHGLFKDECRYELGHIIAPDGERIMANLAIPESRASLKQKCLGSRLRNGVVLHGGFFLGPKDFYDTLRAMDESERRLFFMTGVFKINQLDNDPDLYKAQRIYARFINTGIMVTLNGAVVSDGLEDTRVLSGVGGQYNFVAMAHQLLTGRSILMIRAARETPGKPAQSNVVFNYAHCTIPRHLRDVVITEYGIADLRSQTDAHIAKSLINIADSRFQDELLAQAKRAGKIEEVYEIPQQYRQNTPQKLEGVLAQYRQSGYFPDYPLGCDFTAQEQRLAKGLSELKQSVAGLPKWKLLWRALKAGGLDQEGRAELQRLNLHQAQNLEEKVTARLLWQLLQPPKNEHGTSE